jgi:hypothetical protein
MSIAFGQVKFSFVLVLLPLLAVAQKLALAGKAGTASRL